MRVLIVEDESALADAVARGFRREGMAVDTAYDGDDGFQKASATRYDVIVLDRNLPGMSGDELCRRVTGTDTLTRVIMLTASDAVVDRVAGLSLGADDYLSKPFSYEELTARVRALYRRATPAAPPVLVCADVELDPGRSTVRRNGVQIDLTRKEIGLLQVLMVAGGNVVSSVELLNRVWDNTAAEDTAIVRVTMMNLRRKLGAPAIIHTVIGTGYRIDSPPSMI